MFKELSYLKDVSIPDSITSIGKSAFYHTNLIDMTIPQSVKQIGDGAFEKCTTFQNIEFRGKDCEIGERAFAECSMLKVVKMHRGRNNIPSNAFENASNNFTIEWKDGEINVTYCHDGRVLNVTAPDDGRDYAMSDWDIAVTGGKLPPWNKDYFGKGESLIQNIKIEEGITAIGLQSFSGLDKVETIDIPDTVSTIADYAFENCSSLKGEIIIPKNVNSIGTEAFSGCTGLEGVKIFNPQMQFQNDVFKDCRSEPAEGQELPKEEKLKMYGYSNSTANVYADQKKATIRFIPFDGTCYHVYYYYGGTQDKSRTIRYLIIKDINEENQDIKKQLKQQGTKDGYEYNKYKILSDTINIYYTKKNKEDEIKKYTVSFHTKDGKKIEDLTEETIEGTSRTILSSESYINMITNKLKDTKYYATGEEHKDDNNNTIRVICAEKGTPTPEKINYTVKVCLDNKNNVKETIPNRVTETPEKVRTSDSFQKVLKEIIEKYKENYHHSDTEIPEHGTEIYILLEENRSKDDEEEKWYIEEFTVDFYHSDDGRKIEEISGSKIKGYRATIINTVSYLEFQEKQLGERYTWMGTKDPNEDNVIIVNCRNRTKEDDDLIDYTVKVFLDDWDNQVETISDQVKSTPKDVGKSESLQRVIDNMLKKYKNYGISEKVHDVENAEIKVLLTRTSTTYTIKYYYDYDEKTKETEKYSGMVGDIITKDTIQQQINAHKKEGYILAKDPDSRLLVMDASANIIRVYYVKEPQNPKLTGFRIEYYYNSTNKEEEMYSGEIGQMITKDTIQQQINAHKKEGYILAKDPESITLGKDPDANIIRVYYVEQEEPDLTGFRMEYYYDYQIDNNATEIFPGTIGQTITKDNVKELIRVHKREGYILSTKDNPNPDPLAIKLEADPDTNIMRVYYVKESKTDPEKPENPKLAGYKIQYYYDGKFNNSATGVFSGEEGNTITKEMIQSYIDAHRNGYKFSKTENLPLTLKANIADNVIKVYYIKDGSTNPDPGGEDPDPEKPDPKPDPGGEDPDPGKPDPTPNPNPGGTNPGSNNQGGSSNGNGNGSNGGAASSSTGTSSKGNGKTITGSPSDSLASKIIPKTGLEVGLLVGIITLSGVAVVCYKKSKWN